MYVIVRPETPNHKVLVSLLGLVNHYFDMVNTIYLAPHVHLLVGVPNYQPPMVHPCHLGLLVQASMCILHCS